MKTIRFATIALLALLLLAGCRSSRRAAKEQPTIPTLTSQDTLSTTRPGKEKREVRNSSVKALTAKMNLKLQAGNKSVNCTGTYRLKRDEVVQLNLVYTVLVLPVNVGSLELTPDSILLVDRINKRYCRVAYSQVPELKKEGIDFRYLQRVFWGDDEKVKSNVVSCLYNNWISLSDGKFPQHIDFTLKGSSAGKYKATFVLSKIQETEKWETHVDVPVKYKAVSLKTVMNAIMSVAK